METTDFAEKTEDSNKENVELENNSNLENNENEKIQEQENENSPENLENSSSESEAIEIEDANTTNCLALTIQKDHKLVAVKNVFVKTIKMTWKVIVSTITLGIIKLFS